MFTGIVEDLGKIKRIDKNKSDMTLDIGVSKINSSEIVNGESISVNGVCLTVTTAGNGSFTVEVSEETIARTNLSELVTGSEVNLERSLQVGGRLGGHFVTGHIDGTGRVDSRKNAGNSIELWFKLPYELTKYIIPKGSVSIDGVSLTVNRVVDNSFSVNIIPFTQKETTFGHIEIGDTVNIECDIIGKYVEKFTTVKKDDSKLEYLLRKLRV